MRINIRKADKKTLKTLATSKEVQNNEVKVNIFVAKRSAYGELRY